MADVAIVEDERNILMNLRLQFEGAGHSVRAFQEPVVALPKLIFEPPELLILNGWMPRLHGIDFFVKFRQFSRAPVIFISASADDIQLKLEQMGMSADEYVQKPFSNSYVLSLSESILRRPKALTG